MQKKMKINFASLLKKNEKGYFIVESLIAVIFLSVFLMWLGQTYALWKREDVDKSPLLYQVQHMLTLEAQWSNFIETKNKKIYFHQVNGDIITISLNNHKLRRQVNNRGHEEMIRNIRTFTIKDHQRFIHMVIETNSGETIETTFIKFI